MIPERYSFEKRWSRSVIQLPLFSRRRESVTIQSLREAPLFLDICEVEMEDLVSLVTPPWTLYKPFPFWALPLWLCFDGDCLTGKYVVV